METKLYNYKILVEPDIRTGTNQSCYTALIPTLGVASDGDTIEEAIKNVKEAGSLYLESLIEDGIEIPQDSKKDYIITSTSIRV